MIKKILVACIALFILIGVAAANETAGDLQISNDDSPIIDAPVADTPIKDTSAKDIKKAENTKKSSVISIKSVSGKEGKNVKIKAVLKDGDGNLIKNSKVTFKINGKKYSATTNNKGKAVIDYKLPKAKHIKTIKTKKGKILTKKEIYKTTGTIKISFNGSDKYNGSSAKAKVVSKKSPVVKKYKFKNIVKTEVVPLKYGDNEYKRGPVIIQVIYGKDYGNDDLWIAVDTKDHQIRLQSAAKLHSKDKSGKWKWDKKWTHNPGENDWIVTFYGDIPNTDLIKVKFSLPKYVRIK